MRVFKLFPTAIAFFAMPAQADPPPLFGGITYDDDIVVLSHRKFFVGATKRPYNDNYFYFLQSIWLHDFKEADPLLAQWDIRFQWTGQNAEELLSYESKEVPAIDEAPVIHDLRGEVQVNGYDVDYGGSTSFFFTPKNSTLDYKIRCSYTFAGDQLRLCDLAVVYPYDTHIMLRANRFFPPPLDEIGDDFERIAQRLVDVAICLDVTEGISPDSLDSLLIEYPGLTGCEIDLPS